MKRELFSGGEERLRVSLLFTELHVRDFGKGSCLDWIRTGVLREYSAKEIADAGRRTREHTSRMAPRLLSLLSLVQSALIEQGVALDRQSVQRSVSYHKGLARMSFEDGGSISLQSFTMADGQICVKAALMRAGQADALIHAIYPHRADHDWRESAESIALAWVAGSVAALPMQPNGAERAAVAAEPLVAVG